MKALVVSIWVFINLLFFGMCGYMYVLWSQYWFSIENELNPTPSPYDQQIYFYNRGYMPTEKYLVKRTYVFTESTYKRRAKRLKENQNSTVTLIRNSKPRFPNVRYEEFELDTRKYRCRRNIASSECDYRTTQYKEKLLKELNKVLTEESGAFRSGSENPYGVQYLGSRSDHGEKSQKELLCELKNVGLGVLKRANLPVDSFLRPYLPKRGLYANRAFNTCAIISSSGSLWRSNLGKFIDSHDLVLRFNNAPTSGFEKDVGRKTTLRVLNSQVVTKERFNFLQDNLYKNITLVAWDPSNYTSHLADWLNNPEYNLFPNYIKHRKSIEKSRFFLVDPRSMWRLWNFLQKNSHSRIRKNPPSSGFLGLALLLPVCDFVHMFEYIPSTRVTSKCHYYASEENSACTFGIWHPLAAEKLIAFHLNIANDSMVFQKGFIRIPGFKNLKC